MLSKAQNKYIRSLSQQKYRKEHNAFVIEGEKLAAEWLKSGAVINIIVALEDWITESEALLKQHKKAEVITVKPSELAAVSSLQTPNRVLVVAAIPQQPETLPLNESCLVLDDIRDPGNMGTIIRIADWFGIKHIVCSPQCVDVYNNKVVQSAMGSHLRVQLHETDLKSFLPKVTIPILAAALGGENIYSITKPDKAMLVIGSESHGISQGVLQLATQTIEIPRKGGAESLNAAVATGILCAMLYR